MKNLSLLVVCGLSFLGFSAAHAQWPTTYHVSPKDLPRPFANRSKIIVPRIVPQPKGAKLHLPPGFTASVFASDLVNPRWMAVAPNGDVFVVESRVETGVKRQAHSVEVLRDKNHDGHAEEKVLWSSDFNLPFGIAFHRGYLYVANTGAVVRWSYKDGQTKPEDKEETVISGIPERGYNQHWTRNILFSADGKKLYLTIGSLANEGVEEARRAAISEYPLDENGLVSGKPRLLATGLRNPVGMAFNPKTGALWSVCNERDYMGDDLVPDFLTEVKDGGFYGWPYFYIGPNRDPRVPDRPDLKRKVLIPDVLFTAHSAPLGLCFYTGNQFPAEYQGDAFVAMHGSTNRRNRTGYKVVRVHFDKNGRPAGGYQDFLTGWMLSETGRDVWGRPAGLALLADGSMLVADDSGGKIWRVSYKAKEKTVAKNLQPQVDQTRGHGANTRVKSAETTESSITPMPLTLTALAGGGLAFYLVSRKRR